MPDILGPCNFRDGNLDAQDQTIHPEATNLPARNNSDHNINAFGKPFIELVQTSGLVILNGRTLGDIFGAPTCIQRNGVSTVDYICTSPGLLHQIRYLKVGELCQYSDHKPLSMALTINQSRAPASDLVNMLKNTMSAPLAYKWTRDDDPT